MKTQRILRSRFVLWAALMGDLFLMGGPHDVSRSSFQAAVGAQEQVTEEWLAKPGVVGTAVGMDGRGGAALTVYLADAGAAAMLPHSVAGVPVQAVVTGRFMALGEPPEKDDSDAIDPKAGFPRPVPIGVSTGHPDITAGTIGARVTDGSTVYALSNNHVFAANNSGRTGDNLLQPGVADGGRNPDDVIATLEDYEPIQFCGGLVCPLNQMDAALARTTTNDLGHETPKDGYGAPRSSTVEASLGTTVQKYGRTTGHTEGRITGVNAIMSVSYRTGTARFENQIVITGNGFSAGGDSGSLIVTKGLLMNDRHPVGLLFAGTNTSTLANPIDLVLDRFGVTVDGG